MSPGLATTFVSAIQGEPRTQDEANKIIEEIQDRKGHLSESTTKWLAEAPAERRDEITRKFNALRRDAIKYIKSTTMLNSSDAHFIHEILQNADDARYSRTCLDSLPNKDAWIQFQVWPDRIVVESNEDGFTRADVEALCETGESSKRWNRTGQQIGEKGIGFKSIFRIAEQVHIASGLWAFRFEHPDDDDGLGMVTPLLDPSVKFPPGPGTRMTIILNQRYRKAHWRIAKQFDQIDDTIIFFLRNIHQVEIVSHTGASQTKLRIHRTDSSHFNTTTIEKTLTTSSSSDQPSEVSRTTKHYRVVLSKEIAMPRDARRQHNRATVELAFPTDATYGRAVLDPAGQCVFAFLPMYRKVQLPFLIQSDFITAANRESTEDCDWNDRLLELTADTFCTAIADFCDMGVLEYEWPKYVPTLPLDGLWEPLQSLIITKLQQQKVLCTWETRTPRLPPQLRRVQSSFKFEGVPLVADLTGDQEVYLSPEYEKYTDLLKKLGVRSLQTAEAFDRITNDLNRSGSRIRDSATKNEWHISMAAWVLQIYQNPALQYWQDELRMLRIVPMASGEWRRVLRGPSQPDSPLYFPTLNGVRIPGKIGLNLIDLQAASSLTRATLLSQMGVKYCIADTVARKIFQLHESSTGPAFTTDLVDQLYFLYRFKQGSQSRPQALWISTDGIHTRLSINEIYLMSDEPFSADWVMTKTEKSACKSQLDRDDWILHSSYMHDRYSDRPDGSLTWKKWLTQELCLHEFPDLTTTNMDGERTLSHLLTKLLEFSTQLFLDVLRGRWHQQYRSFYFEKSFPQDILRKCWVTCANGESSFLSHTYLPTTTVMECARELGVEEHSKILKFDPNTQFSFDNWSFLAEVGVHRTVDLDFYVTALRAISENGLTGEGSRLAYAYIGANAQRSRWLYLKRIFTEENLIEYYLTEPSRRAWCQSTNCVWDGPAFLTVKSPIAGLYKDNSDAAHLFCNILELPDASWKDIIDQLKEVSTSSTEARSSPLAIEISTIYLELFAMENVPWDEARKIFSAEELIFASDKWFTLDHCLWTSAIEVQGYCTLQRQYPDLEFFFTRKLGVKKASAEQIVVELIRKTKSKNGLTISEAKMFIKHISALLETEDAEDGALKVRLEELRLCKIFPVRGIDDRVQLEDCAGDFAIRDHYDYSLAFEGKCPFLDFTFEEFSEISHLLDATSLDYNLISGLVEERPSVGKDASYDRTLTAELHRKAHGFLSCAYKYRSSRALNADSSLLEDLRKIQIYTCSSIVTELVLELGDLDIKSFGKHAQVLVETKDGKTSLFLPSSEQQRRSVSRLRLPQELINFMEIKQESARFSVSQLLLCPLSDIEDVMRTENIPIVPWLKRSEYDFMPSESDITSSIDPNYKGATTGIDRSSSTGTPPPSSTDGDAKEKQIEDARPNANDKRSERAIAGQSGLYQSQPSKSDSSSPLPNFSNVDALGTPFGTAPRSSKPFKFVFGQGAKHNAFVFGQPSDPIGHSIARSTQVADIRAEKPSRSSSSVSGSEADLSDFDQKEGSILRADSPSPFALAPSGLAAPSSTQPVFPQTSRYRSLLDQVIHIAQSSASQRATGNSDPHNIFDISSLSSSLPQLTNAEAIFGPPGRGQNYNIGAAGELYVFEYLKKLSLLDFGVKNWQSRIRKHVRIHPSYSDLSDWNQAETSDIVYQDLTGQLRQWLQTVSCNGMPNCSNNGDSGHSQCKYYIEVKTTVSPRCDEKFFLSKGEYSLMQGMSVKDDVEPSEIYVIVRVFNLTSTDIGFKVFVDPLRSCFATPGQPSLKFEVNKWEVYPATGMCQPI